MTANFIVESKQLGRRRPLLPDRAIPFPPELPAGGGRLTLRDLIGRVVREEVAAFRQRQEERRLFRVLTEAAINAGAAAGKIDPAGHEIVQETAEEEAMAAAWQAFEDGLYYVFVDGEQQTSLD